jgi:hypothetical protein
VAKRWCKSRKFFGETVEIRNLKDAKNKLTFFTQFIMKERNEAEAMFTLKGFFIEFIFREKLKNKFRDYVKWIIYIQRHIKNRVATQYAKVEVLTNYWEKVMINLQLKATEFND